MGWWNSDEDGSTLVPSPTGLLPPLAWGDIPANIMDVALDEITGAFIEELGREPTPHELVAGLRFSILSRLADQRQKHQLYVADPEVGDS
jgi:hypothetical protein